MSSNHLRERPAVCSHQIAIASVESIDPQNSHLYGFITVCSIINLRALSRGICWTPGLDLCAAKRRLSFALKLNQNNTRQTEKSHFHHILYVFFNFLNQFEI